jgi:hypothetical protein
LFIIASLRSSIAKLQYEDYFYLLFIRTAKGREDTEAAKRWTLKEG